MKLIIQKHKRTILLIYTLLTFAVCLAPRRPIPQTNEISSGWYPKEGDNFKLVNKKALFKLQNGARRRYLSKASFFSYPENKPFNTPYEKGGILICDKQTFASIPLGEYLPFAPTELPNGFAQKRYWADFRTAFFRKDKVAHVLNYIAWAILFLIVIMPYRSYSFKDKAIFTFIIGSIIGLSIEYLQDYSQLGRAAEVLDVFFNSVGLLIGIFIYKYKIRS